MMVVLRNGQVVHFSEEEYKAMKEMWTLYEALGKKDALFVKKMLDMGHPTEKAAKSILSSIKWMHEMGIL